MAVTQLVQEFLRQSNVGYSVFLHMPGIRAQEEAAVTHISGRDWAKPVVFFADGEPIQAVVPADLVVDVDRLLALTGAERIRMHGHRRGTRRALSRLRAGRDAAARSALQPAGVLSTLRLPPNRSGVQRRHAWRCGVHAL